jgi:hypothetical protein
MWSRESLRKNSDASVSEPQFSFDLKPSLFSTLAIAGSLFFVLSKRSGCVSQTNARAPSIFIDKIDPSPLKRASELRTGVF